MHYKNLVLKSYEEAVQLHPTAPSDLKRALKAHERVPSFITNLCVEIERVQDLTMRTKQKKFSDKLIKELVYDMTNMFIAGVESEAKARYESDVAKTLRESQAQSKKDLESSATGKLSGEYKDLADEAGMIMTDERSDV